MTGIYYLNTSAYFIITLLRFNQCMKQILMVFLGIFLRAFYCRNQEHKLSLWVINESIKYDLVEANGTLICWNNFSTYSYFFSLVAVDFNIRKKKTNFLVNKPNKKSEKVSKNKFGNFF